MTHDDVQRWLDGYIDAWRRNERQPILDLFSEDATYSYGPYREPLRGREAIADSWLAGPDAPDSWAADYRRSRSTATRPWSTAGRATSTTTGPSSAEYDNIFVIRFDDDGRATEFAEWFVEKPVSPAWRPDARRPGLAPRPSVDAAFIVC